MATLLDTGHLTVMTMEMEGEIFALEAEYVREIMDPVPITDVPGAPAFVNGLINVRGRVVPLADLRLKFGMALKPPTIDTRFVVIEIELAGDPTLVGVRADRVYEVTELPTAALEEAPRIGMRWRPEYIRGIGKRGNDFIVVLDVVRIFADGETDAVPVAGEPALH